MSNDGYAGDLRPLLAYQLLEDDPNAVLIDVRTTPEWQFVGVPSLDALGKTPLFLSWQVYPEMRPNASFVESVTQRGVDPKQPILLLCRSGQRSRAAAIALTAAGYAKAYNVAEGFEGNLDDNGHRGVTSGWKKAGLPWIQQ
jgi:rhodanese-related sulfurtransferase